MQKGLRKIRGFILGMGMLLPALAFTAEQPKNVLLICVDDLRPELNGFGAEYIHSPNIDALAESGRAFIRHYVNAPSCGPSRYAMLTGLYPVKGRGNDFLRMRAERLAKKPESEPPSMPEWFRQHGYTTVSVGKVSHHPGGLYGTGWADPAQVEVPNAWDVQVSPSEPWGNPLGAMHGYANGKIRNRGDGSSFVYESVEGPDTIYPDGLIAVEGLKQLEKLAAGDQPFFLAIGLIKPHLPFGAPAKYMDFYKDVTLPPIPHPEKPGGKTTWHGSGEFMKYERWGRDPRTDAAFADEVRRHYAACVTYADKHVGDIMAKLKETGADKNTIVMLWGDHGWHLGEHGIWGKHSLFEESLHAPLIVSFPGIGKPGAASDAVVETVDIFPTLCGLTEIPTPEFIQGTSLEAMLENPAAPGHTAVGYYNSRKTIRTKTHRMIEHKDGFVELYDHAAGGGETVNVASERPELVEELQMQLNQTLEVK